MRVERTRSGRSASASLPTSSMSAARRSASACIASRFSASSAMTPSCAASMRETIPATGVRSSWAMSAAAARRTSSSRASVEASWLKASARRSSSAPPPTRARAVRSPRVIRSVVSVSRRSGRTSVAATSAAASRARPRASAAHTSSSPFSCRCSERLSVPNTSLRTGRSSSRPTGRPVATIGALDVKRGCATLGAPVSGFPRRSVTVMSKPATRERSTSSASERCDQPPAV